jgi:hypothetical protein
VCGGRFLQIKVHAVARLLLSIEVVVYKEISTKPSLRPYLKIISKYSIVGKVKSLLNGFENKNRLQFGILSYLKNTYGKKQKSNF